MMDKIFTLAKYFIRKGKTGKAIDEINNCFNEDYFFNDFSFHGEFSEFQNEIISISNRYSSLEMKARKNIIDNQDANQERSRIVEALLSLIDEVENLFETKKSILHNNESDIGNVITSSDVIIDTDVSDIEIIINKNFSDFSLDDQKEFLQAISHLLKIDFKDIKIKSKKPGSVKLTIELPSKKAKQLHYLLNAGELNQYNVTSSSLQESSSLNVLNLICCGGDDFFRDSLSFMYDIDENVIIHKLSNPIEAYNFLRKSLKFNPNNSYVVICEFGWVDKGNFIFPQKIQSSDLLKHTPVILFSNENEVESINVTNLLSKGIDDCYQRPVNWSSLKQRIKFLLRYKKTLTEIGTEEIIKSKTPFWKRLFDIFLASTILICFSPVLFIIALAIKFESGGPVIYRSKRIGKGYQVFDFLKFRSMCQDADDRLSRVAHLNEYDNDKNKTPSFIRIKNDPRITRIGRIIRKTSLDEIPQLFNVLRGDMSIVGNRPLPLYEAELITKDEWAVRFLAPAGITGLWQVAPEGKDNLSEEERIGLDIEYAKKISFWMDLKIVFRTLPAMIQKGE